MSDTLQYVGDRVAERLDAIKSYFKPGVRITILVRRPGAPEQDFVMTDDELAEIRAMLDRREAALPYG